MQLPRSAELSMKWILGGVVNLYAILLFVRLGRVVTAAATNTKPNTWRLIVEVGIFEILLGLWLLTFVPILAACAPICVGSAFIGAAAFRHHVARKYGL